MSDYETFSCRLVRFRARPDHILQAALAAGTTSPISATIPNSGPHGSATVNDHVTAVTARLAPSRRCWPGSGSPDYAGVNGNGGALTDAVRRGQPLLSGAARRAATAALQALAYDLPPTPPLRAFLPRRGRSTPASHVLIDFNRCIMCESCVRASREVDGITFALAGRAW